MKNYITKVSAKNLKGFTFDQPLARLTHISGLNMVGKTARVQSLALATTHSVPGAASKPSDIYAEFSSGPELQCYAEDFTGEYSGATWMPGRKPGSVTTDFEGGLELPPLLFSVGEFADLGPKDRTKFLFDRLPPPDLSLVGPAAIVAKLKSFVAEPHTEHHEAAVNGYASDVYNSWNNNEMGEILPVPQWLAALVETVATQARADAAAAKTMRQTVLGTAALRKDAPALAPVQARLRVARQQLQDAVAAESTALANLTHATRAKVEAETAAAASTTTPAEFASLGQELAVYEAVQPPDPQRRLDAAAALEAAVQAEATALAAKQQAERELAAATTAAETETDEALVNASIQDVEEEIMTLKQVLPPGEQPKPFVMPKPKPVKAQQEAARRMALNDASTAISASDRAHDAVDRITLAIAVAKCSTCCPTCGSDVSAKQQPLIEKLNRDKVAAEAAAKNAADQVTIVQSGLKIAEIALADVELEMLNWEKTKTAGESAYWAAQAQWSERSRRYNAAQQAIVAAEKNLATLRASLTDTTAADARAKVPFLTTAAHDSTEAWAAAVNLTVSCRQALSSVDTGIGTYHSFQRGAANLRCRLQALKDANLAASTAATALPTLETAAASAAERYKTATAAVPLARAEVARCETAENTAKLDAAAAAQAQQAADKATEMEARAEVGKAACGILDALLKESIAHSVGPLLAMANKLCDGILDGPLVFVDGQIVVDAPSGRTGRKSASGAQRKLIDCVLAVGLATNSPIKLVWLDDVGTSIDRRKKETLYTRLAELLRDGLVDQVLITDTEPWPGNTLLAGLPEADFLAVQCGGGK